MDASPPSPRWRRSSYSGGGNNCVEAARLGGDAAVRDSKNPLMRPVVLSPPVWQMVLDRVKAGEFDLQ